MLCLQIVKYCIQHGLRHDDFRIRQRLLWIFRLESFDQFLVILLFLASKLANAARSQHLLVVHAC